MDLFQQITPHTTLLTPNRRLSAVISKQFSQWQVSQKKTCWKTLDILPLYPSWLERLWKTWAAQDFTTQKSLLSTHQENILWEKILREDPTNESLLQLSDTATLAKSAWENLKRWRVDLSDPTLQLTDDSKAFVRWAKQFENVCQSLHRFDHHTLADQVSEKIQKGIIATPSHIILIGFTELAPQYQFLLKCCEQQGTRIEHYQAPSRNEAAHYLGLVDSETEILTMARWAKHNLDHSNSIGCIVPNLETQRETIFRIFSDVLAEENFNISAGKNLILYPVIHAAIQLLNLPKQLAHSTLSYLLRSPFIGEAEREKYQRAHFESQLRHSNISVTSLQHLLEQKEKINFQQTCPALAKRVQKLLLEKTHEKKYASEWVDIFNRILKILGWPGERSVNSHEYQVIQNSWLPLLNEFSTCDNLLGPLSYQTALHYLTCMVNKTVFQPESPEAPVQILGLLEAADIPFDYSWVMGLDDTVWPSRPKPNPFIPLCMQKTLGMPNSSAEKELSYCQKLTEQLLHSATTIIFSYPKQCNDAELRPSSLLKKFNFLEHLNLSPFMSIAEKIYLSQQLEWLQDDMAPAIDNSEPVYGGVSIFKKQAQCPFKAFAELRLHANKIEETSIGLRPQDRGSIVHKALENIWRELKKSEALITKTDDELHLLIHDAAHQALHEMIPAENTLTRYFALELTRLKQLVWNWLQIEKNRPPFQVIGQEQEMKVTLGDISVSLRIDRIDELADGGHLIIDYKTGKNNECKNWFSNRLDEPQLPLYCIATQSNTIGMAFAQIHPSAMEWIGASKTPVAMKSIKLLSEIKYADATLWDQQVLLWNTHLEQLGKDFIQGLSAVDPKDPNLTCRLCDLKPICRIYEAAHHEYDE